MANLYMPWKPFESHRYSHSLDQRKNSDTKNFENRMSRSKLHRELNSILNNDIYDEDKIKFNRLNNDLTASVLLKK